MSTKLNAQELALAYRKRIDPDRVLSLATEAAGAFAYAAAIREHSQPLADKLDKVTDQRDELLQIVMDIMATPVPDSSYHWLSDNGFTDRINAIVDKCTPKP
jgi:hypothetical protein